MPILTVIDKTVVEAPDFVTGSSDLTLRIPLSDGEVVSFTAETQFFTPRYIATSRSDVLGLPSESMVERTANNVPVVKLPIGATDITTPQYYPNSVVRDMYQVVPIDNFFQEITDDLALPEDTTLDSLRQQRDAALQAALSLDDLNAALDAGDQDAIDEANQAIDTALGEGFASALNAQDPEPEAILSPEEFDELSALDIVGLTDDYGQTDGAEDIIDPTPEVLEEDLIQRLPLVAGKAKGINTINQAITLLNSGIQSVEETVQAESKYNEDGQCKEIVVARGKKGFLGIGKKSQRTVKRTDIEEKLKTIDEEISKQEASNGPIPGYGKKKQRVGIFARAARAITQVASKAGVAGQLLGSVLALPLAPGRITESLLGRKTVGMTKNEILVSLRETKKKLEDILAKDC
jgi:hypothetical protein